MVRFVGSPRSAVIVTVCPSIKRGGDGVNLRQGRRTLAGLAAAALGVLVGVPATAAVSPVEIQFYDVTVGHGTDGVTQPIWLNTETDTLTDAVVTIATAGVKGVVTVRPDGDAKRCAVSEEQVRCTYTTLDTWNPALRLAIAPAEQAKSGASGAITISVSARDLPERSITAKIDVGDVVDLVAEPADQNVTGKPGGTIALPGGVRNSSGRTVDGVVLWGSSGTDNVRYARKGDNCLYTDELVACKFAQDLKPGARYNLATPITLDVRADAPGGFPFTTGYFWDTTADGQRWFESVRRNGGVKGAGPALTLAEQPKGLAAQSVTDPKKLNNINDFLATIGGDNSADQIAVGGTFRGAVGSTVTAKVGLRNPGPARVDTRYLDDHSGSIGVRVVVPSNATVTAVEENNCAPAKADGTPDYDKPALGARDIFCWGTGELEVAATHEWQFTFRVDQPSGTAGSVTMLKDEVCCGRADGSPSRERMLDRDPSNNTAAIVVALPEAGAAAGAGGGLPVTGAAVGTYVAAGAGLVGVGLVGLLLARRHRTRFTV
jgi:hypothetical protein